MNNDINVTPIKTNNGPMLAMMQNHTVVYIPANDEGKRMATGILKLIDNIQREQIAVPHPKFDPKRNQ